MVVQSGRIYSPLNHPAKSPNPVTFLHCEQSFFYATAFPSVCPTIHLSRQVASKVFKLFGGPWKGGTWGPSRQTISIAVSLHFFGL